MDGKNQYEDIIYLPHPVSLTRPRMSMLERAAQFSPFAALTGYEDTILETARITDECVELDEESKALLNEKIQLILDRVSEQPEVSITYFEKDERKSGGAYICVTGRVKKVDLYARTIVMLDQTRIRIDQVYEIDGALFNMA